MPYLLTKNIFGDSHFWKYFSSDPNMGQSLANVSMTGDYSTVPKEFVLKPPTGRIYVVSRILLSVRDTGMLDAVKYGNNIMLANGIDFVRRFKDGSEVSLTPVPIKTNAEWSSFCEHSTIQSYGNGDEYLSVSCSFDEQGGPIWLRDEFDERLVLKLSDDFDGLNGHTLMAQGRVLDSKD